MSDEESGCGCGGCVSLIIFILLFWAVFFGLAVGGKTWNIDIFPPRIWEMKNPAKTPINNEAKK